MADIKVGHDAIRFYLTGDPTASSFSHAGSLGGVRVPYELGRRFRVLEGIPGLLIEHLGFGCPEGQSTITVEAGLLKLRVDGDLVGGTAIAPPAAYQSVVLRSVGPPTDFSNGYVRLFNAYGETAFLEGALFDLVVIPDYNNVIGMGDISTAGGTTYRAVIVENVSEAVVSVDLSVAGGSLLTFLSQAVSGGDLATAATADEDTIFAGIDPGDFLTTQTVVIRAHEFASLLIRRVVPASAVGGVLNELTVSYTISGKTITRALSGYFRVFDAALAQYEIYKGEDAQPDFTAAPDETSATLPMTITVTPADSGETKIVNLTTCERNQNDLRSLNRFARPFEIDDAGTLLTPVVTAPSDISLTAETNARYRLQAAYVPGADVTPADTWHIWITHDGTAPDSTDPPDITLPFGTNGLTDIAYLNYVSAPLEYGVQVRALVRAYASAISCDSINTTEATLCLSEERLRDITTPTKSHRAIYHDSRGVVSIPEFVLIEHAAAPLVRWVVTRGACRLYVGTIPVLAIAPPEFRMRYAMALVEDCVAGFGAASKNGVEVVNANTVYLSSGGLRLMKIDLTIPAIQLRRFDWLTHGIGGGVTALRNVQSPIVACDYAEAPSTGTGGGKILFNTFSDGIWRTCGILNGSGKLSTGLRHVFCATDAEMIA